MQTDRVRTVLVILFLASLFLGSLAGCGGGGGSPGNPDSPVQLQSALTGNLTVTVGSLPPNTGAALHVAGPNHYAADLTGSQTLGGIEPGDYTVTALPVSSGATTWIPTPPSQTVSVAAGASTTASVNYAASPSQPGLAGPPA